MGREARRQRPPDYGHAERRVRGQGAFVMALGADLRVPEHYRGWVEGRDLPRLWRQMDWTRSSADIGACAAAMAGPGTTAECDALAALVADMGLRFAPGPAYPWPVGALLVLFQVAAYNDVAARIGVPPKLFSVELDGLAGLPPGRRARHDCAEVERDARWVYRYFVRRAATDSIHSLAAEWAEQEKRATDARSVVQNGIDRGVFLLDLAMSRNSRGEDCSK